MRDGTATGTATGAAAAGPAVHGDRALAADRVLAAERALARAARRDDPAGAVTATLAARLGCWAMLVDRDGRVRHASGEPPSETCGETHSETHGAAGAMAGEPVAGLVRDLADRRGPSVAIGELRHEGDRHAVVGYPCGPDAVLVVGRATPFGPTDRAIAGAALRLLDLAGRQRAAGAAAVGAVVVDLLTGTGDGDRAGDEPGAGALAALGQLLGTGAAGVVRVLVGVPVHGGGRDRDAERLWWSRRLGSPLVSTDGAELRAITARPVGGTELADLTDRGWAAAVSAAVPPHELPRAIREAAALATRVRVARRHLRGEDAAGSTAALVDPAVAADYARRRLRPVLDLPADRRHELLTTLRAWLAAHGGWDASARALGVHRNTVRRLIGQLEPLLAADLADPQVRADLWLALDWLDRTPTPPAK